MGKIPPELKRTIAANIRACRMKKFPGRGGGKMCAEALGVSPQQWSPWERGKRTPDEARLSQIADFFGVTAEFLRDPCAHSGQGMDPSPTVELPFHPPPTLDDSPFPPSSADRKSVV